MEMIFTEISVKEMFPIQEAGVVLMAVFLMTAVGWTAGHGMEQTDRDGEVRFNMATYNIFFHTPSEHANSWEQRREHVASIIRFHDIAIWGAQEGKHNQLQDLQEMLGYEYVGVARDDGDKLGEHSAIMYDPVRFEALDSGTFWLSRTPDRPSMDWGVNYHRICTWGRFQHRGSGAEFYIYNAHFDHESQEARENSSRMVLEHVDGKVSGSVPDEMQDGMQDGMHGEEQDVMHGEEQDEEKDVMHGGVSDGAHEGMPVVFMGDLNAEPGNRVYEMVMEHGLFRDAKRVSKTPPHGPPGTFNGFDINRSPNRRIDYLFVSGHFEVHRYGVLTDTYLPEGALRFPSDHFPVVAEVTLRP